MTTTTRDQLIADLQTDRDALLAAVHNIPAQHWSRGVYEHGWTAKQLLAHIAAIEWTYPKLIERAQPASAHSTAPDASQPFDMDAYNQRQVQRRADHTIDQLLDEFAQNRQATIAAIQSAPDHLLKTPTKSAGGVAGTLLDVLNAVARDHVREHLNDLRS